MTKEELWDLYTAKNPQFIKEGASISFTPKGLRQFFDRTFDHAFQEGLEFDDWTNEPPPSPTSNDSSNFEDVFGALFGTTFKQH